MTICNNKKCSLGECDQPETCTAYVPVITRADKIRAMNDEELADLINREIGCCAPTGDCEKMSNDCKACWLDWLNQSAEEGER